MTTVILAEKPSQARSYVQAFQKSTKKQGYYTAVSYTHLTLPTICSV